MLWPQLSSARVAWSKSCGRGKRDHFGFGNGRSPQAIREHSFRMPRYAPGAKEPGAPWAFTQSVVSDNTCPSQPNTRVRYTQEDSPVGRWPRLIKQLWPDHETYKGIENLYRGVEGGRSAWCRRNRLRGNKRGASDGQNEPSARRSFAWGLLWS